MNILIVVIVVRILLAIWHTLKIAKTLDKCLQRVADGYARLHFHAFSSYKPQPIKYIIFKQTDLYDFSVLAT